MVVGGLRPRLATRMRCWRMPTSRRRSSSPARRTRMSPRPGRPRASASSGTTGTGSPATTAANRAAGGRRGAMRAVGVRDPGGRRCGARRGWRSWCRPWRPSPGRSSAIPPPPRSPCSAPLPCWAWRTSGDRRSRGPAPTPAPPWWGPGWSCVNTGGWRLPRCRGAVVARHARTQVRQRAGEACQALAELLADPAAPPTVRDEARARVEATRRAYDAAPLRPAGPANRDRALVDLVIELGRALELRAVPAQRATRPERFLNSVPCARRSQRSWRPARAC